MDHVREAAIRARAHQLWIESGYADGQQDKHWRQAEREVLGKERLDERTADDGVAGPPRREDGASAPHSDGTSLHPSFFDTKSGREGT